MAGVLFVCVENAGRSQMAEAFLKRLAPEMQAKSAGTRPGRRINPAVIEVMREVGIDITSQRPKPLSPEMAGDNIVVNMGCMDGEPCPVLSAGNVIEWKIEDPAGVPMDRVRSIRDEIESQVRDLIAETGRAAP